MQRWTRSALVLLEVRLLVEVMTALLVWLGLPQPAAAQATATQPNQRPFEILDNSFIVEEAFNQEAGIFQNILGFVRSSEGEWELVYTQEWPIRDERHQLSYTVPFAGGGAASGLEDVLINYRYQAFTEGPGRPAFAPRLSLILPSGNERKGLGSGTVGWQVNLPLSKQTGDLYWHWNAGFTHLPAVDAEPAAGLAPDIAPPDVNLFAPHLAGSVIWRATPMFNLMLEALGVFDETVQPNGSTSRETLVTISPGMRGGWNFGDQQIIAGLAVPVGVSAEETDVGVFLYFSYELPFRKR